jgi:type IV secretion system protein VirB3
MTRKHCGHHTALAWLALRLAPGVTPGIALAQASPFMTGVTSLQTNILAWLTPIAIILVMLLGAMAMANRMSWGWCVGAIFGIAIAFGAPQIVAWVRQLFNLVFTRELFLLTKNLVTLLSSLLIHAVCVLLCARDPRFFDLLLLWGRTRLPAALGNLTFWKASSYSPLTVGRPQRGFHHARVIIVPGIEPGSCASGKGLVPSC